jgi:TonB-dependent SusC/RagA subfamily outer membrane receptor
MRTGYDPRSLSRDDIESIEIVKGAAAERLYGAEGRHGVIVITTRKR